MQPTEHKQPTEEELIAHIRQSLMAHEETYEAGAWEKFNKQQTKKRPFLWISVLSGAAAILALCVTLLLMTKEKPEELKNELAKSHSSATTEQPKATTTESLPTAIETQKEVTIPTDKQNEGRKLLLADATEPRAAKQEQDFVAPPLLVTNPINNNNPTNQQVVVSPVNENPVMANVTKPKPDPQQAEKMAEERPKPNIMDFFDKEAEKNKANPKENLLNKRENRWELGVMVAPSFGNTKKLNMGYGLSMEYNLSDKLSLSSGIAYNEMTASKSVGNNGASASPSEASAFVQDTRNLTSVSERVVGLDIPLELKYHISNNVYANFGISAFAILNYQRENTYFENKLVSSAFISGGPSTPNSPITGADGASFTNSRIINQLTTEPAPESSKNQSNYIGFYNLSVGYKKKISKNNSVAIEPFMKLPMKEVSKDNLKLIGTGLRLKFDF
ncbi:hypothetical protein [Pedobacter sp. Hv1]|uniref:hypothetical protein n=1 Tax=Pedobacter sp. Hv1 TaxID=1740090 RepID=UPI0006D8B646|nr:hypothetical protein [Pedobacter sp. Hv1]KQB99182.1 hypothetical protein AQF98_16510 [Pedobacter sp. Hv1]